jgi:CHAT domain-containing protein
MWLASLGRDEADRRRPRVVVAAGPRLDLANVEVEAVAEVYDEPTVLTDGRATVADVLAAMEGADVAHLVAHGSAPQQNPLLASIELADGPLYAYDLQRLQQPPRLVVLAACNVGTSTQLAVGEQVGMASVLIASGTRSVVATSGLLPDTAATAQLAAELHRRFRRGASVAESVAAAQNGTAPQTGTTTDWPVTMECLGAG